MKKIIRTAFALFTTLYLSAGVFASQAPGAKSAVFIHLPASARALSLKNAVTASSYGSEGVFYNPAMISYGASEMSFTHKNMFAGINNQIISGSLKINDVSALGLGVNYVSYGNIDVYEVDANDLPVDLGRTAGAYGLALNLAYSRRVNSSFSAGVTFKFINEAIDNVSGTAFGMGAGLYYAAAENLKLGLAVDGIATKIKYQRVSQSIPVKISGGISYSVIEPLRLSADIVKMTDDKPHLNAALEIFFTRLFVLRAGASTLKSGVGRYSAGLGFNLNNLKVDYAYEPGKLLESVHSFSLTYAFSPFEKETVKAPSPEKIPDARPKPSPEKPKPARVYKAPRPAPDEPVKKDTVIQKPDRPDIKPAPLEEKRILSPAEILEARKQYNEGVRFYNNEEWFKALVSFKGKIEADPDAESYYYAGMCYVNLKHYEKSIEEFKKGIELSPFHYELNIALATSYFYLNDFKKAAEVFKKLSDVYPDDKLIKKNLEVLVHLQ